VVLKNVSREFKFHQNLTRKTGTLHEVQRKFFTISRLFLLKIRNVSVKICRENQNTDLMQNKFFSRKLRHLSDNVGKYCVAGHVTDDNMAHTHCMLDN